MSNGEASSSAPPAGGPHFLESEWVIWEHRSPDKNSKSYEDNMVKLLEVATIEDFWRAFNNEDEVSRAMALQHDFVKQFNVPIGKKENCTFAAGDPRPEQKSVCAYPTAWLPEGPFPTAQYSFFVPRSHYSETVQWVIQRRNGLDLLVHPNSGCEIQDHLHWAVWGGNPWELNEAAFHCDSPGCIPPP